MQHNCSAMPSGRDPGSARPRAPMPVAVCGRDRARAGEDTARKSRAGASVALRGPPAERTRSMRNDDAPHLNPQVKLDQLALKMEILRGMSALGDRASDDEQTVS